jgi:hypothetical protein
MYMYLILLKMETVMYFLIRVDLQKYICKKINTHQFYH